MSQLGSYMGGGGLARNSELGFFRGVPAEEPMPRKRVRNRATNVPSRGPIPAQPISRPLLSPGQANAAATKTSSAARKSLSIGKGLRAGARVGGLAGRALGGPLGLALLAVDGYELGRNILGIEEKEQRVRRGVTSANTIGQNLALEGQLNVMQRQLERENEQIAGELAIQRGAYTAASAANRASQIGLQANMAARLAKLSAGVPKAPISISALGG